MAPPSEIAGPVHTGRLADAVNEKVKKYAGIATRFHAPLIAAVGLGGFTGLLLGSTGHALINHAGCPS
ncbi:hypothetical protein [Catelliglobosispora koreensis]|uniref:hypothetical protein n=1 Tax=Catelliglobosispora koreensis TaxID=129052 RepID=UPI0003687360|nr:hypothetical protein [Catelliglobosispora koreensis]